MTRFDPIIILLIGSLPLLVFSLYGLIRSIIAKNDEIKRLNNKPADATDVQKIKENLPDGIVGPGADSAKLAEELASKEAEIKRLNTQAAGILARQDALEKKVIQYKKMEEELDKAKSGYTNVEARLAEKDFEIRLLTDKLSEKEGEIKRIADQLSRKDADIDELASQLAANFIEIKQLNDKLSNMKSPRKLIDNLTVKTEVKTVGSGDVKALSEQLTAKDAEIEGYLQKIKDHQWEVDKLLASSDKKDEQIAAKDAEIKRLRQKP